MISNSYPNCFTSFTRSLEVVDQTCDYQSQDNSSNHPLIAYDGLHVRAGSTSDPDINIVTINELIKAVQTSKSGADNTKVEALIEVS